MEVGVFRFQIVSLIKLLADRTDRTVKRYGVTPLSPIGIGWESDYAKDGEIIHDAFGLAKDYVIYKGLSNEPEIVKQAQETAPYNLLFIDGSHIKSDVDEDFKNYAPLVKSGGYLVIDDAACRTHQKWGEFQGISDVCEALSEWESYQTDFVFQFNVVHNMIYKRK